MMFRVAAAWLLVFSASLFLPAPAPAQQPETLTLYTDHPRLFLRPNRLRLLKRERERRSLRWDQFDLLMAGKAPMPEQGFASALYFRVTENPDSAKRAIAFALGSSTDLHQLALVYDWCQDVLTEAENRSLAAKMERLMSASRNDHSISAERSRLLAAFALAGHLPAVSAAAISTFMENTWPRQIVAGMRQGRPIPREDTFALFEIFHVVRDNLNVDLRESYPAYFKTLPIYHLLSHYPPPWPAAENEYRIPAAKNLKEDPDLTVAALSRAAELAMVAYDANAPETQVLQGWLMNDQFLLRGTFGITYELLWANPYQPGLSYYHVPLVFHDELFGRLLVRSSWEDNAEWLGFFDGQLQLFSEGKITLLNPSLTRDPLDLDEALVFFGREVHKFKIPERPPQTVDKDAVRTAAPVVDGFDVFVVGLEPRHLYHIEIDDEEMTEVRADPGGILYFPNTPGSVGVRLAPSPTRK